MCEHGLAPEKASEHRVSLERNERNFLFLKGFRSKLGKESMLTPSHETLGRLTVGKQIESFIELFSTIMLIVSLPSFLPGDGYYGAGE